MENLKLLKEQKNIKIIIMKSVRQFEDENRIEIEALFDRIVNYDGSILNKLEYKNLVFFLYSLYHSRGY